MQVVTLDFKKNWRHRFPTKKAQRERHDLKQKIHRANRRAVRQALHNGDNEILSLRRRHFVTGWEVI